MCLQNVFVEKGIPSMERIRNKKNWFSQKVLNNLYLSLQQKKRINLKKQTWQMKLNIYFYTQALQRLTSLFSPVIRKASDGFDL